MPHNGLPLAAGPISRCPIAKVSVCLCEVKVNEANAQQCPAAERHLNLYSVCMGAAVLSGLAAERLLCGVILVPVFNDVVPNRL